MKNLLTTNLDLMAESSGGLDKIRETILELAVQGRLVPQDPADEPTLVLLNEIAEEKRRLAGHRRRPKSGRQDLSALEEWAKDVPEGWEIVRLCDLAEVKPGFAFSSQSFNSSGVGLPLVRIRDVGQKSSETYYSGEYRQEFVVRSGDFLVSMDGVFRVASWEGSDALLNQRVSRLDFYLGLQTNSFVTIQLQMRLRGLQGTKAYTTVDHLSGHQIEDCIIALPPLPEQKRIVARVDELLGLCDELEERQRDASGAHERLTASALSALSRSSTAAQIGKSWKFVAQYFDGLFTTLDSVDLLKQVILDLAVRGFLVPQNPDDEPAGELLERVTAEKQRRTFAGHSRNLPAQLGPPTEVTSGALPRGWQWAAFGDVALDIATGPFGSLIHKSDYVDDGVPLVNPSHMIDGRIVADLTVTLSPERAAELEPYRLNAGDIVMARRGEAGRAALVTEAEQGWLCGTGSFVVRFVPEMDRGYVQLVLASRDCRRFLAGEAVGSTMSNLNHGILKRLPFPVPPLAEQERVVTRMDALMTMCDQLRDRIASAAIAQEHVATALARVNSTRI